MRAIAVLLLVVSFLLHPCVGHAAWPPNGSGVSTTYEWQVLSSICPDGAGGTIITWYDVRTGNYDIYAQRLNGLGVAQWTPNGVVVCSAPSTQFLPNIVSDGNDGAIVTWWDLNAQGNFNVFAQRLDPFGAMQWPANGVALCTVSNTTNYQVPPAIISDGAGGAIVAWTDERNGNANKNIYAQRVDASGVVQWTANGVALCAAGGNQTLPEITSDSAGGAIVTWEDLRGTDIDIYARRVDASGGLLWLTNGAAVCTAINDQAAEEIIADGSGGAIVTWDDRRSGAADIYAQRLNDLGVWQWPLDGVPLCNAAHDQTRPALVSDGLGGGIVAWNDGRSAVDTDIYAQRVNSSGHAQWIPNGVPLCTAVGSQNMDESHQQIASDGTGGAFVTWGDPRNGLSDIYAQRVDGYGAVLLAPDGDALCTATDQQDYPAITYTGPFGDAVVTWSDYRNGVDWDIYALPVPNTGIGAFKKYVPYPNGIIIAPDPKIWPVHLLFHNVVAAGFTYLDITPAGPSLPPSFVLGDGRYYNLSTTAGTTDNIDVCIKFDPAALQHPAAALRMFEYNVAGPAGPTWLDVTTGTAAGDSICGTTTTLSTFVIGWPSVTGVGDTPAPASFALHPNLPNPFNPITTIRYDVPPAGADVNISIYDVSGRLVRELVKEHRSAGNWSVQWDGTSDHGGHVASGVYFYRMRAGEFVETRKMMLLK